MADSSIRKHEVPFCADVKSWLDALFAAHPDWPFDRAEIEESGRGSRKRSDLKVYDRDHRTPVLTGEVKMPGTPEGRNPLSEELMQDAAQKAENLQADYFFTWNVNKFVLFDRSQWKKRISERRIRDWDLDWALTKPGECGLPEVQARIRDKLLPTIFGALAAIVSGRWRDWGMPLDELFIKSLDADILWPVEETRDFLALNCEKDKTFASLFSRWLTEELQWTLDPDDPNIWRQILDRAARTLCYVFCNRAIFYQVVQARYPDLRKLGMPSGKLDRHQTYEHFRKRFVAATEATGDYEPVFFPHVADWASELVFAGPQSRQAWKSFFANLDRYDFREIPHDTAGKIFQKLIAPEERRKFGQHFTHDDIVDVINAFCIRRAGDLVLDPACGSGSFLVRAYHRKAWLSEQKGGGRRHEDTHKTHQELLQEIYGCDIAVFPAHLATLNLASRNITNDDNYPLIRRGNFFEVVEKPREFCKIPVSAAGGPKEQRPVAIDPLDAIVGNPPYVRQELIQRRSQVRKVSGETAASLESRLKNTKEHLQELASAAWSGLKLSGRSDLHCYFWPVATRLLKEDGYFGFLTSSSWLDVEYGFALQRWILQNFKLLAVMESVDEPWFEDARIKTCVTILQRCSEPKVRDANLVKFVRLQKPLADILGRRELGDEAARQEAASDLRRLIESTKTDYLSDDLRIIVKSQAALWQEGVEAGRVLGGTAPDTDADEEAADSVVEEPLARYHLRPASEQYVAGKWGRYLRAPNIYFRLMKDYGHRFVKLGEIAEIRRGITSGCDAFFMPHDVTDRVLQEVRNGRLWNNVGLLAPCSFKEVESGKVRIVETGDKTLHPIEAEFLRPELHSLMEVDRPVIRAGDVDRVVLWVNQPLRELAGTHVARYIRWGAKQTFASSKSKAVSVPRRTTCAARPLWYDLAGIGVGTTFWPMSQQYRHLVPANPDKLVCNHNLFYLNGYELSEIEALCLPAVLNSTLLALFKTYYGRYAGTEGNLKTEVVDVKLLEVPSVKGISTHVADRMLAAFSAMQKRPVGHLVEESFMHCHTVEHVKVLAERPVGLSNELQQEDRRTLDDAVLEMVGVADPAERARILDELYYETAKHYRQIRVVEVQKMVQRAGGNHKRITAEDLAAGLWDSLNPDEQGPPLMEWLGAGKTGTVTVIIPDGKATALGNGHMFTPAGVDFRQGKAVHHETYANPEQAALVAALANLEIRGPVELPPDEPTCREWRKRIQTRILGGRVRFAELAETRTGDPGMQDELVQLMTHWYVHGREAREE